LNAASGVVGFRGAQTASGFSRNIDWGAGLAGRDGQCFGEGFFFDFFVVIVFLDLNAPVGVVLGKSTVVERRRCIGCDISAVADVAGGFL